MTRPFQDIAAAADDIAAGNWTRQVPIRGSAESMTMAVAFNEMSTHLRHWHQEAQDRSARLEASYERFSSVTESARDAIISTDQDGRGRVLEQERRDDLRLRRRRRRSASR